MPSSDRRADLASLDSLGASPDVEVAVLSERQSDSCDERADSLLRFAPVGAILEYNDDYLLGNYVSTNDNIAKYGKNDLQSSKIIEEVAIDHTPTDAVETLALDLTESLCRRFGIADSAAVLDEIRKGFATNPEIAAIGAVRELRDQIRSEKIGPAVRYPGRRSGVDPVAFLTEHYGTEIRDGRLGPGQLQLMDAGLYMSLRARLGSDKEESDQPSTIADLFQQLATKEWRSPYQRRVAACAEILGTDEATAARFLASIRPERVRDGARSEQSATL